VTVTVDPSRLAPEQRIALLEAALAELDDPPEGRILVGAEEARLLWYATVDSFAGGIWVATILCAQATCERALAGVVSLRELPGYGIEAPKGWEMWGLGKIVSHVRKQGWVPSDVLAEVEVLCEARKPYGHWRRPFDPGTLGRQIADELQRRAATRTPMNCESASLPRRHTGRRGRRYGCTSATTPEGRSTPEHGSPRPGSRAGEARRTHGRQSA
jgi:hypothetical protein